MIAFLTLMSIGGYLLVGGIITWIAVRNAPNRWVVDWLDGARSYSSIDRVATRFLFWVWPMPVLFMTVWVVLKCIGKFFSLSDSVTRLARPDNVSIK